MSRNAVRAIRVRGWNAVLRYRQQGTLLRCGRKGRKGEIELPSSGIVNQEWFGDTLVKGINRVWATRLRGKRDKQPESIKHEGSRPPAPVTNREDLSGGRQSLPWCRPSKEKAQGNGCTSKTAATYSDLDEV